MTFSLKQNGDIFTETRHKSLSGTTQGDTLLEYQRVLASSIEEKTTCGSVVSSILEHMVGVTGLDAVTLSS